MEKEKPNDMTCAPSICCSSSDDSSSKPTDPCQDDEIVVPSHPLHDSEAGDESKDDEGSRYTQDCYGHGEHDGSSVLELAGRFGHSMRTLKTCAFLLRFAPPCSPWSKARASLSSNAIGHRAVKESKRLAGEDLDGLLYDIESTASHWNLEAPLGLGAGREASPCALEPFAG